MRNRILVGLVAPIVVVTVTLVAPARVTFASRSALPIVLNVHQVLHQCRAQSVDSGRVLVRGQMLVRASTRSRSIVYGGLFDQIHVFQSWQNNGNLRKHAGLVLAIPQPVFHKLLSMGALHPPVTWVGRLTCEGGRPTLHVSRFEMFSPTVSG